MKKRFFYGLLASASIAAVISACSNSDDSTTDPYSFDGRVEAQLPKEYNWNTNSQLGLYHSMSTESGKNELKHFSTKLISGGGTNLAAFEPISNFEKGTHILSAHYPYNESHGNDPKKVAINLPSEQYQAENTTNDNSLDYSFFYATKKISVNNNNNSINFGLKNLFSVIEFDITLESPDQKISEITVTSQDKNLAGDFIVDLTADKVDAQIGNNTSKTITLKSKNDVLKNDASKARITINPLLEKHPLKISVKVDGETLDFDVAPESYLPNRTYNIPLIIYSPAEDLNTKGYANSYIVNEASKAYKFDAKVQGNGKATSKISPKKITPKKAFVVWESSKTEKGVIANVSIDEKGIVTFITSDKIGGNALIAVTDGEPTDEFPLGTILWSWHIWSTPYDVNKDITVKSKAGDKFQFMAINLGALSVDPDKTGNGLKYQWGRKDPFLKDGFKLDDSGHEGIVHNPKYGWQASTFTANGKDSAIDEAIKFPTGFFKSSHGSDFDWNGKTSGIENRNNELWGNLENNLGQKSIYDPCPIGYRVPPVEAFESFESENGKFINEDWEFNAENGQKITFSTEPSYLMYTSGAPTPPGRNGKSGYYWTSSTKPMFVKSNASSFLIEKDGISVNQTSQRASGASIRCIRE